MNNTVGTAAKQVTEEVNDFASKNESIKDKVTQTVSNTKEKMTAGLSSASNKIHQKSDTAQEFFDAGADNINNYAHQAIEKANQYGHRAAEAINSSSQYIENFDYGKTKQQVLETIKEKPQVGLAVAGLVGLFMGLLIGRRNSR